MHRRIRALGLAGLAVNLVLAACDEGTSPSSGTFSLPSTTDVTIDGASPSPTVTVTDDGGTTAEDAATTTDAASEGGPVILDAGDDALALCDGGVVKAGLQADLVVCVAVPAL